MERERLADRVAAARVLDDDVPPSRSAMRWDALILLRELCRTGRAIPCAAAAAGGRCTSAWLCMDAPLWVLVRVCELLRGELDDKLLSVLAAAAPLGYPAGLDWAIWRLGEDSELSDVLALPEDGSAKLVFSMTPRFGIFDDYFDTYLARVLCSVAPATLRLYGPLTAAEALAAIGRAVIYEEHRNAFFHLHMMHPKHGGTFVRYRAKRVRTRMYSGWCYDGNAAVLSTAPLPDPSVGLDLPGMIALTHRAYHELVAALDPHGPQCRDLECLERRGECEIPGGLCLQFDFAGVSKREDGSWGIQWGKYHA